MSARFVAFHLVAEQCILLTVLLGMHGVHAACMFVLRAALGEFSYATLAAVVSPTTSSATTSAASAAGAANAGAGAADDALLRRRGYGASLASSVSSLSTSSSSSSSSSSTSSSSAALVTSIIATLYRRAQQAHCVLNIAHTRVLGALERAIHYASPCAPPLPPFLSSPSSAAHIARFSLCPASPARFSLALSFILWTLLCFGAVFVLHLPSCWKARVQMARPMRPLRRAWYDNLRKPWYNPPPSVFPLVWISVKTLQCAVMTRRWERMSGAETLLALGASVRPLHVLVFVYLLSIVCGNMWTQLFFIQLDLPGSVLMLVAGTALHTALLLVLLRSGGDAIDFWLYLPTVVWAYMATTLNVHIYLLNRRRHLHEMLQQQHGQHREHAE